MGVEELTSLKELLGGEVFDKYEDGILREKIYFLVFIP